MKGRENAAEKARRLLVEGRLQVRSVEPCRAVALCRGDSGAVYSVTLDGWEWECTCPARGRCAHLLALALVVVVNVPELGSSPAPHFERKSA